MSKHIAYIETPGVWREMDGRAWKARSLVKISGWTNTSSLGVKPSVRPDCSASLSFGFGYGQRSDNTLA